MNLELKKQEYQAELGKVRQIMAQLQQELTQRQQQEQRLLGAVMALDELLQVPEVSGEAATDG